VNYRRTSISKTRNSALKSALFLLAVTMAVACSPTTRSLFFDIPPPKNEPSAAESTTAEQSGAAQQSRTAFAASPSVHPADLETDRPPIEQAATWEEAEELLPKDEKGEPDWVAAQRDGIVMPRAIDPRDRDGDWFALDFYLENEKPKFTAFFPHSAHVSLMDCSSCHPALFPQRDNEITMKAMRNGETCGACHGGVAFSLKNCKRCHTNM